MQFTSLLGGVRNAPIAATAGVAGALAVRQAVLPQGDVRDQALIHVGRGDVHRGVVPDRRSAAREGQDREREQQQGCANFAHRPPPAYKG